MVTKKHPAFTTPTNDVIFHTVNDTLQNFLKIKYVNFECNSNCVETAVNSKNYLLVEYNLDLLVYPNFSNSL